MRKKRYKTSDLKNKGVGRKQLEEERKKSRGQDKVILNMILTE